MKEPSQDDGGLSMLRIRLSFYLVLLSYKKLVEKFRQKLAGVQVLPQDGVVLADNNGTSQSKHMLWECFCIILVLIIVSA